jgi:hypothetical protein
MRKNANEFCGVETIPVASLMEKSFVTWKKISKE